MQISVNIWNVLLSMPSLLDACMKNTFHSSEEILILAILLILYCYTTYINSCSSSSCAQSATKSFNKFMSMVWPFLQMYVLVINHDKLNGVFVICTFFAVAISC